MDSTKKPFGALDHEPAFVPVLQGDDLQIAEYQTMLRKRFKDILENPEDFDKKWFLSHVYRDALIVALEQVSLEEIADFIMMAVYWMNEDYEAMRRGIEYLESKSV